MRRNGKETKSTRIMITLSDELIAKMDEYCDKYYITRSALISIALTHKMQHDNVIDNMPDMLRVMSEALEIGNRSSQIEKNVNDFKDFSDSKNDTFLHE